MNSIVFRQFLVIVFIICLAIKLDAIGADTPPLPPTRVQEMEQRVDTYIKKGGAPQTKDIFERTKERAILVEDSARRMVKMYSILDTKTLTNIKDSSPDALRVLIIHLIEFENAAKIYFDALKLHREALTAQITETSPQLTISTLEKTAKNYGLTRDWGESGVTFGNACLKYIREYEKTGVASIKAFDEVISASERFETIQNNIFSISAANQRKNESQLPR